MAVYSSMSVANSKGLTRTMSNLAGGTIDRQPFPTRKSLEGKFVMSQLEVPMTELSIDEGPFEALFASVDKLAITVRHGRLRGSIQVDLSDIKDKADRARAAHWWASNTIDHAMWGYDSEIYVVTEEDFREALVASVRFYMVVEVS